MARGHAGRGGRKRAERRAFMVLSAAIVRWMAAMVGHARHIHPGHVHARHAHRGHVVVHGLGNGVRVGRVAIAKDETARARHKARRDQGAGAERHQQQCCQPRLSGPSDRDLISHSTSLAEVSPGDHGEISVEQDVRSNQTDEHRAAEDGRRVRHTSLHCSVSNTAECDYGQAISIRWRRAHRHASDSF